MKWVLLGLFAFGLILIFVTLRLKRREKHSEWKLFAFFSFLVFPLLFSGSVIRQDLHMMKQVDFCGSCHVMEPYVNSLTFDDDEPLASVHYRNNYIKQKTACYSCHTSYAMFGDAQAKMSGMRHVWAYLTKSEIDSIQLYRPYSNDNCLHCHGPSERFRSNKEHKKEKEMLQKMESGETSCLEAGCHDLGHYFESDDEDDEEDW